MSEICSHCGAKVPEGARICDNCGMPLSQEISSQQEPTAEHSPTPHEKMPLQGTTSQQPQSPTLPPPEQPSPTPNLPPPEQPSTLPLPLPPQGPRSRKGLFLLLGSGGAVVVLILAIVIGILVLRAAPVKQDNSAVQQDTTPSQQSSESQAADYSTSAQPSGEQEPPRKEGPTSSDNNPTRAETTLRQEVEDYYEAVDRKDWDYTYKNLDSQTQQMFTKEEWQDKNQWFADKEQLTLSSLNVDLKAPLSGSTADLTINRTFKDGSSSVRNTRFVFEDGSWKHQFLQEEIDLFKPGISFNEFVKAQQGGSSGTSL